MSRTLLALALAAACASVLAPAAVALPPERSGTIVENLSEVDTTSCSEFAVVSQGEATVRFTLYFGPSGEPRRLHVRFAREQTLENSVTGKAVELRGNVSVEIDLATGSEAWNGQVIMANGSGAGTLIHDTGRIVFDSDFDITFVAGPHEAVFDPDVICRALT